ncbi:MAG: hypothetical protein ACPG21_03650 [Crocinitomicaceae bacterium]
MGIPHLASYLTQGDSTIIKRGHEHVYYMLGKLYHLSAAFEKADRYYNKFLEAIASDEFIPADEKEELIAMKKKGNRTLPIWSCGNSKPKKGCHRKSWRYGKLNLS